VSLCRAASLRIALRSIPSPADYFQSSRILSTNLAKFSLIVPNHAPRSRRHG